MIGALRLPDPDARVELSPRLAAALLREDPSRWILEWITREARKLELAPCGINFRISVLRFDLARSSRLAVLLAERLCAALRDELGLPAGLRVELDSVQETRVPPGGQTRSLLPHHDSAHASYLTPSQSEVPGFDPALRTFRPQGITSTATHKLFQGFLVEEPGRGLSLTSYVDKLALLRRAFRWRQGRDARDPAELARWLGRNLERAFQYRARYGAGYLSLAACLGSRRPSDHAAALHWLEADLPGELLARFPDLAELRPAPRWPWVSRVERLFDRQLRESLGRSWDELRAEHELCQASERHDFLIGPNLSLLHGGWAASRERRLLPICLVLQQARGAEYEAWLSSLWRRSWEAQAVHGSLATTPPDPAPVP